MDPEKIATQPEDAHMHDETEADSGEAVESVIPSEASEVTEPPTAARAHASRSDCVADFDSVDADRIPLLTDAMSGLDRNDLAAMLKEQMWIDVDANNDGANTEFQVYWCWFVDELVNLVPSLWGVAAQELVNAAHNRHDLSFISRLDDALAQMQLAFAIDEDDS